MANPQKLSCTVASIVNHGGRVYTVDLIPERPSPRFRAGQFLHLALDPYDPSGFWPDSRVFSLANSPSNRIRLRICYSVVGRFTTRMEQELAVGSRIWIKLPYGDFLIQGNQDIVLFAGGTGITAFTAFLEELTPDFPYHVTVFYGARNANLFIFRETIERYAAKLAKLRVYYFAEQDTGDGKNIWARPGRLSVSTAWAMIANPTGSTYYLSGPPAMLKAISDDLYSTGIKRDSIRIDAWA